MGALLINSMPAPFHVLLVFFILLLLLQHSSLKRSDLGTLPAQLQESCNDFY